ncbi:V-type ATP synthase subunit I [Mediterraneibacter agrestimuris]|uniref:V-type ATP synthase subunit I n=1 Tax=Mediterraneibacter agrestimuris TaxID=2941333 RepID=UPI0020401015|nr:V-type ATP synthase subunit I [Mediterraneibacter agrestimuris]
MAVLQMQRISICALKKNRKAILEKLQALGVMEINHIIDDGDEDFQKMDTTNARMSFDKAAASADKAVELLQVYAPVKQSMLASLAGKELVDEDRYRQVIDRKEELQRVVSRIQTLDKEKAEQKAEILKLTNSIESLTPWLTLGVPMNYKGTAHTDMLLGVMPAGVSLEEVYSVLAERVPDTGGVDAHIISADQDSTYVAVFCMRREVAQVEEALRGRGFAKPSQIWDKVPSQAVDNMRREIAEREDKITQIEQDVVSLNVNKEDLCLLADYYRVRADKYAVLGQIPQSGRTFVISGYVPKKYVPRVEKLAKQYDCVLDIEEVKEDEEAPVLLQNNGFASGAEGVLAAFGLPGKGEIDPTSIMAVFYVFLFGMMLSDAAYGAIVSIACGVLLIKFPRMGDGMKKAFQLFFWCGLSTLFWGILFGGYFGDAVNVISRVFLGHEVGIKALWFAPLDDPMKLLVFSMLFGVIHLFTGLGLKGYMCLRDKKYMDFLCDVVLWYALLCGLLIMLIPSELFASIAQMEIVFPPFVNTLGKALAIIGAVGIVLMSGRSSKNFGLRIALGAYDLYNVSGWLSDVLSYSRLLALGLATGVIASVINQMGSMGGKSVGGVILFIAVFIFGHLFNLAINLLGAYVHTNRLQFVEFFGKFYEGGGREFNPFKANTKYADVKEETKL